MRADAKAQRKEDSGKREHVSAIACLRTKYRPATDGSTGDEEHCQHEQLRSWLSHFTR
jgi:hypothetical protein